MPVNKETYLQLKNECDAAGATLVAVSKTKPVSDILELYRLGHRDFGENYVQELTEKQPQLPADVRWHFIGHLQRNKVKYIAPMVHLIHGVDSFSLLQEVAKQAQKIDRVIPVLLQLHIAEEETKFGLDEAELRDVINRLLQQPMPQVRLEGLMGMASFTADTGKIKAEFEKLHQIFQHYKNVQTDGVRFTQLSMGMSSDYKIAIEQGSTLVRIGSLLFGAR